MFVLRHTGVRHPLVDEARDLRFGIVRAPEPGTTWAEVCWRDLGSTFQLDTAQEVDPATGRRVTEYRTVLRHGWTDADTIAGACEPATDVEIAELHVLVAEAVLVHHHRLVSGDWDPADAVAVVDGRRRTVGDFGYRSGADIREDARQIAPEVYVDGPGWSLRPTSSPWYAAPGRPRRPLWTEVRDPAHDRLLRVRSIEGTHRIEIVGGGVDAWSDRLRVHPDVVGSWMQAFADGRYTVEGSTWGRRFVPDGAGRVALHGTTR